MHKNHLQLSHFVLRLSNFHAPLIVRPTPHGVLSHHPRSVPWSPVCSQRFERKIHPFFGAACRLFSSPTTNLYTLRVWGSHEWFHHQRVRLPSYENILSFGEFGVEAPSFWGLSYLREIESWEFGSSTCILIFGKFQVAWLKPILKNYWAPKKEWKECGVP